MIPTKRTRDTIPSSYLHPNVQLWAQTWRNESQVLVVLIRLLANGQATRDMTSIDVQLDIRNCYVLLSTAHRRPTRRTCFYISARTKSEKEAV